jgi:indole-3-glycerol phosphate synthase
MLEKIVNATQKRVEILKSSINLDTIEEKIKTHNTPFAFEKALRENKLSFICEVKKASPSKGIIAHDFDYVQIAKDYENAGVTAISVLTEPEFFMGDYQYLTEIKQNVSLPLLQKDFTIDESQIYNAKIIGADAILLICSILDLETIIRFQEIAQNLGMSCLVEAHNKQEVKKAIKAGAKIIGVNNRNLKTFEVDINNSIELRKLVPSDIIFVSESGISTRDDIIKLEQNNVNAVLMGETLMRADNKEKALKELKGEIDD